MGYCQPERLVATQAVEALSGHPMFGDLDEATLERVRRFIHIARARRGDILFRKGEPGCFLMIVVEGAVKIVSPAADGREILLNVMRAGDMFGEISLLDGGPRTADAVAQTDCVLATINRRDIVALIKDNACVAMKFALYLCKTLRHTSDHIDGVMFLDVPTRLARALQRIGGETNAPVGLTQRELGQMIGVSRETVNQVLGDWRFRNLIRVDRNGIVVLDRVAFDRLCATAR
jgi:CRP/FNR family cyclic AMP-dependent transcriptional regulator